MEEYLWIYALVGFLLPLVWKAKHGRDMQRSEWMVTTLFWPLTVISLLFDPADRDVG
jgi:hypothetical protein